MQECFDIVRVFYEVLHCTGSVLSDFATSEVLCMCRIKIGTKIRQNIGNTSMNILLVIL